MRIQVNLSDELIESLDKYAQMMGISRSALCATFIGQGVMGYNKSFQVIDLLGDKIGDNLLAEKIAKELGKGSNEM